MIMPTARMVMQRKKLEKKVLSARSKLRNAEKALNIHIDGMSLFAFRNQISNRNQVSNLFDNLPVAPNGKWLGQECPICGGAMERDDAEGILVCAAEGTPGGGRACGDGRMRIHPDDEVKFKRGHP